MNADDIGTKYMRDQIFAYVAGVPGMAKTPDPTWAVYIFHRKFADHRHERTKFRSQLRSTLSTLFEVLNDEERGCILPGDFDIGNGRELPRGSQTYAALERALWHHPESGVSVLKPIKLIIREVLGVPVKQYFEIDRSITLKVLKLLYRYQIGLNSSLCSPKLFSFLKMPGSKRPSFEFNDAYVVRGATDKQRIIDELTVHLGSELGAECREIIRSTFMSIAYDVGVAEDLLKQKLKAGARGNIELCRCAYAEAIEGLNRLRDAYGTCRATQRLDLDLLIYLCRAQVENRNKAHVEVMEAIKRTELPVKPIEADVIRLNANFDKVTDGRAVNSKIVLSSEIEAFLNDWSAELRQAMEKAFGVQITGDQYRAASANTVRMIQVDQEIMWECGGMSLLDVLAFLCMAYASIEHPAAFRYKPYWHGQKNQSNRPFYPLNRPGPFAMEEISEGRLIYWRQCRGWIKRALIGQLSYWELDLQIANHINEMLSQVMATHDLGVMLNFVSALVVFAENP